MLANVIFQTSLCLTDCPAILLDESSEGMHLVVAISSRLPSGSASEWAGDSNPARWSHILQEHSFGTGAMKFLMPARACLVCWFATVLLWGFSPKLLVWAQEHTKCNVGILMSKAFWFVVGFICGPAESQVAQCRAIIIPFWSFSRLCNAALKIHTRSKLGGVFKSLVFCELPKFQNYVCQNDSQLIQSDRDRWRFFASIYCKYVLVVVKESWRQTGCWFDCTGRPFWFKPSHDFEFFLQPLDPWQQAVIAARFCNALLNLRILVGRVRVANVSFQFWGSILQISSNHLMSTVQN